MIVILLQSTDWQLQYNHNFASIFPSSYGRRSVTIFAPLLSPYVGGMPMKDELVPFPFPVPFPPRVSVERRLQLPLWCGLLKRHAESLPSSDMFYSKLGENQRQENTFGDTKYAEEGKISRLAEKNSLTSISSAACTGVIWWVVSPVKPKRSTTLLDRCLFQAKNGCCITLDWLISREHLLFGGD